MKTIHLQPTLVAVRVLCFAALSVLVIPHLGATTYYVHSGVGSDTFSGPLADPAPSALAGPWRTLAKVADTRLKPGDTVLLHCGQTWYESLTIASSGTETNPINVATYPSSCAVPPLIIGMASIPASSWLLYKNNIYKAPNAGRLVLKSGFNSNLSHGANYAPIGPRITSAQACNALAKVSCSGIAAGPAVGTLSSSVFPLVAAKKYTVSLGVKAPVGVWFQLVVRRGAAPWESVALSPVITGTGNLQTYSFAFTATKSLENARVDIDLPVAPTNVLLTDVTLIENLVGVSQVFADGVALNPAHHPNAGFNPNRPQSVYLSMAADADHVLQAGGGYASTYVVAGSDLVLPPGGALSSGMTIRLRASPWRLDERRITSTLGARLVLDKPTTYQAKAGFGYFLLGALWMLDSPGEWFFDTLSKTLYVQMPDNAAPGARVAIGRGDGIIVDGQSNINISGLWIQGTDRGVSMIRSNNVVLANSLIEKTLSYGVDAQGAVAAEIVDNTIRSTGGDAIYAEGPLGTASRLSVSGNTIAESAVRVVGNRPISLPVQSYAAILPGSAANVSYNSIQGAAYHGIRPRADGSVSYNWIDRPCMMLDDCGAIYTWGRDNPRLIEGNLVTNIPGTADGKPTQTTHTVGIYLDDLSSNVSVAHNSVVGADFGIQVHNAANNTISDNTLYGNRLYQLFVQENTATLDASGDLHDNTVIDNRFQPTTTAPSVFQSSNIGDASRFARYEGNRYSTLLSPTIARESIVAGGFSYTFPMWQAAEVNGVPRNLDASGATVSRKGFATYSVAGSNLIANGNFTSTIGDWGPYLGQKLSSTRCLNSPCLQFTVNSAASGALISSPYFSVQSGQYYRVSFDFKTGTDNQKFSSLVRRGAGSSTPYQPLQGAAEPLLGSLQWQRHSYVFQASNTVNRNDPATLDQGARLDFQDVRAGETIFVDNVEVVPLAAIGLPSKTNVLVNTTNAPASMACPDEAVAPAYCNQYLRFVDDTPIAWPHHVDALSAEIIYTVDRTAPDSDGDGVPDMQDLCPDTAPTMAANSKGCAINQ